VRSRNAMEPDNCGSGRNKFGATMALNTSARAADCRRAAAKSHGCRCTPGYHVASAAAARKNAAAKSRGCHCTPGYHVAFAAAARRSAAAKSHGCCCRPAYHVASAATADCKNARCWNSLGGCCCCWEPRAARPGRWRLQTAHSSVPMADDWHRRALFAWARLRADWSFRNLPARGHDPSYFPVPPMCVGCCSRVATECCYS
jgi:hypothetical protein